MLRLQGTQPAFTCSKLTIETLGQRCEICSKLTIKTPKRRQWRRFGIFIVSCEICLKLTTKTPKRRQWRRFGLFIVNFEHISHLCSSVSTDTHVNWDSQGPEKICPT